MTTATAQQAPGVHADAEVLEAAWTEWAAAGGDPMDLVSVALVAFPAEDWPWPRTRAALAVLENCDGPGPCILDRVPGVDRAAMLQAIRECMDVIPAMHRLGIR